MLIGFAVFVIHVIRKFHFVIGLSDNLKGKVAGKDVIVLSPVFFPTRQMKQLVKWLNQWPKVSTKMGFRIVFEKDSSIDFLVVNILFQKKPFRSRQDNLLNCGTKSSGVEDQVSLLID